MSTGLQNIGEICSGTQFGRRIEGICGGFHTKNSLPNGSECRDGIYSSLGAGSVTVKRQP